MAPHSLSVGLDHPGHKDGEDDGHVQQQLHWSWQTRANSWERSRYSCATCHGVLSSISMESPTPA